MKVYLMLPSSEQNALEMTMVSWFAARRCRTDKDHDALWNEIQETNMNTIATKLWHSIHTEWAVDLLRHSLFTFDCEGYPQWFWAELGRHKFIKENIEVEQRSERALPSFRLPVLNPFEGEIKDLAETLIEIVQRLQEKALSLGYSKDDIRNLSFQGVLTSRVMSMNAETVHHLAVMRGSKDLVGEFGSKAAPLFQDLVGQMWDLCRERCPWLFQEVLVR